MKKRVIYIISAILILIFLAIKMFWLALFILSLALVYFLCFSKNKSVVKFRDITYISYPLLLIAAIGYGIFIKTMIFGVFYIPSISMEKTLKPGDVVWVNKTVYGPLVPNSIDEIDWIKAFSKFVKNKTVKNHHKRWSGYSSPSNGDIAVLYHPDTKKIYIKRIVAIPSDTLKIENCDLYINDELTEYSNKLQYLYQFNTESHKKIYSILDSMNIQVWNNFKTKNQNAFLTKSEAEILKTNPFFKELKIETARADTAWGTYPWRADFNWSIDDYGPFILPQKGDVIKLTKENLSIYGELIEQEGGAIDTIKNEYQFAHNYYFMMGDNFHDSEDSRYFGPVKKEYIIGKATLIIFSKNKNSKRFFRRLK